MLTLLTHQPEVFWQNCRLALDRQYAHQYDHGVINAFSILNALLLSKKLAVRPSTRHQRELNVKMAMLVENYTYRYD